MTTQRQRPHPPLAAIIGPTASGKTDLALALARHLPLEILVADSRQVFRGMDIGTAKPDATARAAVPHHLLDMADPDQRFTVADWLAAARPLLDDVATRGRIPLIVGGTGLYVSALVDGYELGDQPWAPELRRRLADELEHEGLATLAARLRSRDPAAAARIDMRNPRRVLRALERLEASGGAAASPLATPYPGRVALIGIGRPRPELHARIERRAAAMFAGGLLDEVRALHDAAYGAELGPMSGHGYREAAAVLDGSSSLEAAVAATVRRTRQYAKRQMTWFGRDRRVAWLQAGADPADSDAMLSRARRLLEALLT